MIRTPDTTIGQRLAIAFALLIVPLAALFGVALSAQLSVADKQRTFEREILPRARVAEDLERGIFDTALLIRKHLIEPSEDTRLNYIRGADRVMSLRGELATLTRQPEDRQLLVRFDRKLDEYLALADEITEQDAGELLDLEVERLLQAQRERVLGPLREMADLEKRETSAVLEGIIHYSERVFRGLLVAGGVGLLLIVAVSIVTARSIRRPILSLVGIATALERGDWGPARRHASGRRVLAAMDASPPARDEAEVLRRAFGHAAAALERRERRLCADREVAAAAATEVDVAPLARAALGAIVAHLDVEVGAIYLRTDDGLLERAASHALTEEAPPIRFGEGICGQSAVDRRALVVDDIPVDTPFLVGLGFAQAPPRAVAAVPMCVGDELVGVVLVGSLHDLDRDAVAFLEHAAGQLGVALLNARAHARIRDLVAALQSRSEQLQAHTEELQAQSEELHAQNEELLAQGAQLQEATRALGESNRRKSEFLAVLAHEIRNPLAPICNGIDLLERAPPGGDIARRARETIARQARQLSRLVDALLDLTRVDRGQIALERARVDLGPLVSDVVEDNRPLFAERGVQLDATLPEAPVLVCGDATRLIQIVGNLLHNAAKFTDVGGHVALTLEVEMQRAVLSIRDTGVGIEPDMLPTIFEPFTQADSSLDRSGAGLGLGLALVKGLVELHGGEIAVHSEGRGRGARFVVSLPLDEPGGAQEEVAPDDEA